MNLGLIPGLCDFSLDKKNKTITEKNGYGLDWMKKNYNKFSDIINESIKKLLNELPNNINDINDIKLNGFNYDGILVQRNIDLNPLYKIASEINSKKVYELIFEKTPDIKKEWLKLDKYGNPRFISIIEHYNDNIKKEELEILFFNHDIIKDYLYKLENSENLHKIINYASYSNNIDFLKEVLQKINLEEMEKNKYSYDLSLSKATTIEVANLLLENNAVVEQYIQTNNQNKNYCVNLLLSDELKNFDIFNAIVEKYPKYKNEILKNTESFYKLIEKKDIDFIKKFIKKYNFPLEKFDMLNLAFKKKIENNLFYEWVIKNGADTRNCMNFCHSIVTAREEGLKELRSLNKSGLIVSKSPDIIYGILFNNPTKSFLNYYDKLTDIDLEKYTKDDIPVWWAAKQINELNFVLSRIKNPTQTSQNNKPYFFFILERELQERKSGKTSDLLKLQFMKIYKLNNDFKYDLDYVDQNGNNFLHFYTKLEKYGKECLDVDLIDFFVKNSKQNPYEYFSKKNNKGLSPIEILLRQTIGQEWSTYNLLIKIINNGSNFINFQEKMSNGEIVGDKFKELFKSDKVNLSKIESIILNEELKQINIVNKKIKI